LGNEGHFWAKPLEKEKSPKHLVAWKLGNCGENAKVKGRSCTPKSVIYWGHPWAVSRFGEK